MSLPPPFVFHTERRLVLLTGRSACNLVELQGHLRDVSGASVFYHTHQQFLSHHFEKPSFHNDFADWIGHAIQGDELAERLAALDLLACTSVRQVRESILEIIETHLASATGVASRNCPTGDEFHFCESQSFIVPTGIVAHDLREFLAGVSRISLPSVFFHFFEARLRLEHPTNDFSIWLRDLGQPDLADQIDRLNPYVMTLDELRDEILRLGAHWGGLV